MLLWDVQIAMIQINLLMKSHHQKLGEKTDVATEYTKEDEYKELEKAKDLKQKPVLNEIDALITEKGFTNKTDYKAGKTIKING